MCTHACIHALIVADLEIIITFTVIDHQPGLNLCHFKCGLFQHDYTIISFEYKKDSVTFDTVYSFPAAVFLA